MCQLNNFLYQFIRFVYECFCNFVEKQNGECAEEKCDKRNSQYFFQEKILFTTKEVLNLKILQQLLIFLLQVKLDIFFEHFQIDNNGLKLHYLIFTHTSYNRDNNLKLFGQLDSSPLI